LSSGRGEGKGNSGTLLMYLLAVDSLLFLASASFCRNSFCFTSNDFTPSEVTSDRAGVRERIVLLENGRSKVAGALNAAGAFIRRLENIVMLDELQWFDIEEKVA
jgi:hypothetical protein